MRWFFCLLLLCGLAAEVQPGSVQVGPNPRAVEFFHGQVLPLLEQHCFECHGPGKVRGDLRLDSLERMLTGGNNGPALVPGDPDASLLVTTARREELGLEMPPDEPLSEEQVAILERWVEIGAPWPLAASASAVQAAPVIERSAPTLDVLAGRMHPALVHFPIACLLLALLAELLAWRWPQTGWVTARRLLVVVGALGAVLACVTGLLFAGGQAPDLLNKHRNLGFVVAGLSLLLVALEWTSAPRLFLVRRILLVLVAVLVAVVGHFGGEMVYGRGWPW